MSTMAIVQLRQKPAAIGIKYVLCFVTKGDEASQMTTLITILKHFLLLLWLFKHCF